MTFLDEGLDMKKALILIAGIGMAASYATADESPRDAELSQAIEYAKELVSKDALSTSLFGHVIPGGGPTDYVQYLFSDMGIEEWDQSEAGPAVLIAGRKNESEGKQVVIRGVEGRDELILEAYSDPEDETPDWEARIRFPEVMPDPKDIVRARRLVERGVSFRHN